MFKLLHISVKLSSGYHPETNGQTERTNQTLEQYLRCFINYQQDDWVDYMHLVEFASKTQIGSTPFCSLLFVIHFTLEYNNSLSIISRSLCVCVCVCVCVLTS